MFTLKKNEGFDRLLKMIGEQNEKNVDHSDEIEKILNSLKLTMKTWKTDTGMYYIIKYDKTALGLTQDDFVSIGLLRSVVVDESGKIVSYSPPKSLNITAERETQFNLNNIMSPICDDNTNEWDAEEFVEGTMINLFYSEKGNGWEVATKSTVGGNVTFFSPKNPKDTVEIREKDTFRNMFFETCKKVGLNYEDFPKEFMYSFVLQHPKNRIVLPITEEKIYITGLYTVNQDTLEVNQLNRAGFVKTYCANSVLTPKSLFSTDYTVAGFKKEFASMNSPYNLMGIVFINMVTGERMKVRNPNYELVKNAKGTENKMMLQYLSLRHGGRVAEYLKSFPEYKSNFSVYRNSVHIFTKNLHQNYLDCFVLKKKPFGEFPQQFKKYMIQLNKKYIDELRENRNCVTFNYVMEFVNKIEPGALLFSLNYVVREHKTVIQRLEEPIEKEVKEVTGVVEMTDTVKENTKMDTVAVEKVKQE